MVERQQAKSFPISVTAVVALILGVAALLLLPIAEGMQPIALILAVAAVLVGVVGAINSGRRGESGAWLGYGGAALGAIAALIIAVTLIL
ncbi:hypothetical protein [Microbacterium luteum]|uniref:hypothetical protein n=1 Tax=Microbacterium luteum TaxID=2782167 RepID=UPI001888A780|nr:hypothetical protein [Microbacterium luteum]